MLVLHSFPSGLNEPSLSNFCTKAMILLSLSERPWHPHWTLDARAAPFGKLPALETPDGVIGDSNLMLDWLEAQGTRVFPGLDDRRRACARAVMRMAEENLRYGMMHDRWVDPDGWAAFEPIVFGDAPRMVRLLLPGLVRKGIVRGLKWQGLGRFGPVERLSYFRRDLDTLTDLLWQSRWLFGDHPTAADAAVLPILSGIDRLQVDTGLRGAVRENTVLMRYIERGRVTLYPGLLAVDPSRQIDGTLSSTLPQEAA